MAATPLAGIILAAGKGTRMKSRLPKVLHQVCGLAMLDWAIRVFEEAGIVKPITVVGHGGEEIIELLGDRIQPVWQREQLGTGHAALMAREALAGHAGPVVITPGDAPGIQASSLLRLAELHLERGATVTLATVKLADPTGYGRIVRDELGEVVQIVEEKDADETTKAITEVGVSVYCVDGPWAMEALPRLSSANAQGEYYLTDLVGLAREEGKSVQALTFADADEFAGVNDRWQLAEIESRVRKQILKRHALNGVTFHSLEDTLIGPDVELGADVTIEVGTQIVGKTKIGEGCHIGPYSRIENSEIGDHSRVLFSIVREAKLGRKTKVGPYAHIRPGTVAEDDCRVGNFVEIKNTFLGQGVSASHLSYLGDARIGAKTNVGAGVVIANYDGVRKHRTEVGSYAFLGSNSTIISPVTVGDGGVVTAGSVLTRDVPNDGGAFGRARTVVIEGWAASWREKTKKAAENLDSSKQKAEGENK